MSRRCAIILFLIAPPAFLALFLGAVWCFGEVRAHDWYAGQSSKASRALGFLSCCNGTTSGGDCKPVPATIDDAGQWIMLYNGRRFIVPEDAILPDDMNGQPLEAHGCVRDYHGVPTVLCFWRRAAGG